MSQLNPYDKFLGGQPPEAILPATPKAIATYLEVIGAERVNVPPALG